VAERRGGRREDRQPSRRSSKRPYKFGRKKVCAFCADRVRYVDYKAVTLLRQYITNRGKIKPRRKTGVCAKHQRLLASAIKRARHVALLPYTGEHVRGS
jgi:small subunit ribosomal protein S18